MEATCLEFMLRLCFLRNRPSREMPIINAHSIHSTVQYSIHTFINYLALIRELRQGAFNRGIGHQLFLRWIGFEVPRDKIWWSGWLLFRILPCDLALTGLQLSVTDAETTIVSLFMWWMYSIFPHCSIVESKKTFRPMCLFMLCNLSFVSELLYSLSIFMVTSLI